MNKRAMKWLLAAILISLPAILTLGLPTVTNSHIEQDIQQDAGSIEQIQNDTGNHESNNINETNSTSQENLSVATEEPRKT